MDTTTVRTLKPSARKALRVMRIIPVLTMTMWILFATLVGMCSAPAYAQDQKPVFAPIGCKLDAASMAAIHRMLCQADHDCTARLVTLVCNPTHAGRRAAQESK